MSTDDRDLPTVDELVLWLFDDPEDDDRKVELDLIAAGVDLATANRKIDAQIDAVRTAGARRRLDRAAQERHAASFRRPPATERYARLSTEALRARIVAGRPTLGHRDFSKLSRADLESLLDDLEDDSE